MFGSCRIVFGTSGVASGTGFYFVSLPVTAQASGVVGGYGYILDSSTGLVRHTAVVLDSTTRVSLYLENATNYAVAAGNPWTWAASDQISFYFEYEAA